MENNNLYPLTKTKEFRLKLYPKDFLKVKDFYENLLGYPIVTSWDNENDKGAMFDTGVGIIELLTPKSGFIPIQGISISLKVSDVWTLWGKLKNHQSIVMPLNVRSWGDATFKIADPEGFQISFFTQNKTREDHN